jgi:hypothetical protein
LALAGFDFCGDGFGLALGGCGCYCYSSYFLKRHFLPQELQPLLLIFVSFAVVFVPVLEYPMLNIELQSCGDNTLQPNTTSNCIAKIRSVIHKKKAPKKRFFKMEPNAHDTAKK